MHDPQFLRAEYKQIAERLKSRGYDFNIPYYENLESQRKTVQSKTEAARRERNQLSKEIGAAKSRGESTDELMSKVAGIGKELEVLESENSAVQVEMKKFYDGIPNLAHESVPVGSDENDNLEIRKVGNLPDFEFEPQDHVTLGENLEMMDFELAAKLAGSRFVVMSSKIALLHRAIAQFMLDVHTREHGYKEINLPFVVKNEVLYGTGQLPKFEEDQFRLDDDRDFYLIPTAEVPLTNFVRDTIVNLEDLPMKLTAHTPCFRKEAGSYGKDTRGMIRQHQFEKVELVHIVTPESSYKALEELAANAERILKMLELPYRVVILCTGDMGFSAAKTYDIEVWLPGQGTYREISSCSNCEGFQARRMSARWRNPETNQLEPVHTLNGSGLAVGRTLIAVMENYQNADGSIRIPAVLQPYMGGVSQIDKLR